MESKASAIYNVFVEGLFLGLLSVKEILNKTAAMIAIQGQLKIRNTRVGNVE